MVFSFEAPWNRTERTHFPDFRVMCGLAGTAIFDQWMLGSILLVSIGLTAPGTFELRRKVKFFV
jgi:hypothetical protein